MPRKKARQSNNKHLGLLAIVAAMFIAIVSHQFVMFAIAENRAANAHLPPHLNVSGHGANKKIAAPTKLNIPSIGLNAMVEKVSVTSQGSLGVPKDPMNAGWYSIGPRPGETGTAVIDGHVDWYHGATGVFKNLRKVKKGDEITTTDENGNKVTFKVREVRIYHPASDATEVFSAADSGSHLNLITCNGAWDPKTKQYSERLVVFADKVTN